MDYEVIVQPSSDWATVHSALETDVGGYSKFFFYYVMTRNSVQQVGQIDINDNGLAVQYDHEYTTVPEGGNAGVEFRIIHSNGKRVFQYRTEAGTSGGIIFKFKIDHRIK
jgi:hypothetical protein